MPPRLVLSCNLFVDPEEFIAFVHDTDQAADAGVFGFQQGVEFARMAVRRRWLDGSRTTG